MPKGGKPMARDDSVLDKRAAREYNVSVPVLKLARRLAVLPLGTYLIILVRTKDRWRISIEERTTETITAARQ